MYKSRNAILVATTLMFIANSALAAEVCIDIYSRTAAMKEHQVPTEKLQEGFDKLDEQLEWHHYLDNELDFLRFVRSETYYKTILNKDPNDWSNRNNSTMHGSEIYGVKNYQAWKDGWDYLLSIPKGEFKLTTDVILRAHAISSGGMHRLLKIKTIEELIPDGYLPDNPGAIKHRASFGRDPLFYPITDAELAVLRSNPWLGDAFGQHGFLEIPFLSKPNKRRGIILYASAKQTPVKLAKLEKYYQESVAKVKAGQMDPVDLAAEIQIALVSIHPSVDGNGRLSRLIMDRILREFDLPPPLIANTSMDLYTPLKEWKMWIRDGIAVFKEKAKTMAISGDVPLISGQRLERDFNAPFKSRPMKGWGHEVNYPWGPSTRDLTIGGVPFIFMKDGFVYNNKGIPHAFYGNKLYPISDMAYLMYGENGQVRKIKSDGKNSWQFGNSDSIRGLSSSHKDIYRENRRVLNLIAARKLDPNKIELVDYKTIANANRDGNIYLHPWQRPHFEKMITIHDQAPELVLSRSRKATTPFESAVRRKLENRNKAAAQALSNEITNGPEVLAQYLKVDAEFWRYQQVARQNFPELETKVLESRAQLHKAAKELLRRWEEIDQNTTAQERTLLEKMVAYQAFKDLLAESPLSYKTFAEYLSSGKDDSIVLLRAAHLSARYIGFNSQSEYAAALSRLPGYSKLKQFARDLAADMRRPEKAQQISEAITKFEKDLKENKTTRAKFFNDFIFKMMSENLKKRFTDLNETYSLFQQSLENLNWRIFGSTYYYRGVDKEYDRAFIEHTLHAGGYIAHKRGVSFTSSSKLLTTGDGDYLPFTQSGASNGIMLVRLDRKKAIWNEWGLSGEYEFLLEGGARPTRIVKTYRPQDFKEQPTIEEQKAVKDKLKEVGIYRWEWIEPGFSDVDPGDPLPMPHPSIMPEGAVNSAEPVG